MALEHPFLLAFGIAVAALIAGWLGGVGGRGWRDREFRADVEDQLEVLSRRVSKREGAAGRAAVPRDGDLADLGLLQKLMGAAGVPRQPATDEERHGNAVRFFHRRGNKEPDEGTGG